MLDSDLAELYGVITGNLNKAVNRNIERFPSDFMFVLTREEREILRFQIGILRHGAHTKYLPRVFTQEGVAMLSGVLRSRTAAQVNVAIMRAFVRLKRLQAEVPEFASRMESAERKLDMHDTELGEHEARINEVLAAMRNKRLK